MLKAIISSLAVALFYSSTAFATPFVDITAYWFLEVNSPTLPDGVTVSCFGAAVAVTGCSDQHLFHFNVTEPGDYSDVTTGGIMIINGTDETVEIPLEGGVTAFNPNLTNDIGVSVDDPLTQFASFSSSVGGTSCIGAEGGSVLCDLGDMHSGATNDCPSYDQYPDPTYFPPGTCGVEGADADLYDVELVLGPESEYVLTETISTDADFSGTGYPSLPEPPAILSFVSSLLLFASCGWFIGGKATRGRW